MTNQAPPAAETATRVWATMHALVAAQDRRRELREASDFGRGMGRVAVLLALAEGPLTLRQIAASQGIDAPYATVIVGKLEARGLVLRTPHPAGHRRKLVSLTGAGRKAAAQARDDHRPPARRHRRSSCGGAGRPRRDPGQIGSVTGSAVRHDRRCVPGNGPVARVLMVTSYP